MTDNLRSSLWPAMVAALLSVAPAQAQSDKSVTGAIEASAQKAVASAQTSASPQCSAPRELARLERPLTRTARLLAAGEPIKIVAIGSSSTAGAGASSPDATYPSRLAAELADKFPDHQITVLNRGVNGEDAEGMLARLDTAVTVEKPDLVLWQLGTNSLLREKALPPHASLVREGLARIKATGAEVVLIDPQYAPRVLAKPHVEDMISLIATAAKAEHVPLFHRFDLMRHWYETDHLPFETFVSSDGLHMNDWSYACVAKLLAAAIDEAATRASAVAGGPRR
ncbi:MAG: SGNH/GDSL hydrolase family protein [Burkholderiales bacterium]